MILPGFPSTVRVAGVLLLSLGLAACGRKPEPPAAQAPAAAEQSDAGYMTPPQLLAAARTPGGIRLSGLAPAGAMIRLASPEGVAIGAPANPDGTWSLEIPTNGRPGMFSFAADLGGHALRSEGAVVVAPGLAYPALLARAGAASLPAGEGKGAPMIVSIDYDSGGGASVGGLATPGAAVRLSIDGAPAGQGVADAHGRFTAPITGGPVRPGVHAFVAQTAAGSDVARVELSPAAALAGPYRAARTAGGWRVDWAPPGGGVQTALVLDQGGAGS